MVTRTLLALLALTSTAHAAFTIDHATVYHRTLDGNGNTNTSLILDAAPPSNPYSSNDGKTGITFDVDSNTTSFVAAADIVKNAGPGYSTYDTHGSATINADQPFSISGYAYGRATGAFDIGGSSFGFGYNFNGYNGTTTLPAGQYTVDWNVSAFYMNGTGGTATAGLNVVVPEPATYMGGFAIGSIFVMMTRSRK